MYNPSTQLLNLFSILMNHVGIVPKKGQGTCFHEQPVRIDPVIHIRVLVFQGEMPYRVLPLINPWFGPVVKAGHQPDLTVRYKGFALKPQAIFPL
jgi:hypothetical protein